MGSLIGLREQVNKLKAEAGFGQHMPAGCKSLKEWMARLRKHREKPLEDHGALFPAGSEQPFKWAMELIDSRIANKMAELAKRDWTQHETPGEAIEHLPMLEERTVAPRQVDLARRHLDRLDGYRARGDTAEGGPEVYPAAE